MKNLILTACALIAFSVSGQEVLSSAGDYIENENYSLSYTLGELAIETFSDNFILTQGFQQTRLTETSIPELKAMEVGVFPNPTSGSLNMQTSNPEGLNTALLYDMQGRVLKTFDLNGFSNATISLDWLPSGTYIIKIQSSNTSNPSSYSALVQKL